MKSMAYVTWRVSAIIEDDVFVFDKLINEV